MKSLKHCAATRTRESWVELHSLTSFSTQREYSVSFSSSSDCLSFILPFFFFAKCNQTGSCVVLFDGLMAPSIIYYRLSSGGLLRRLEPIPANVGRDAGYTLDGFVPTGDSECLNYPACLQTGGGSQRKHKQSRTRMGVYWHAQIQLSDYSD